jgi:hypothetical protein
MSHPVKRSIICRVCNRPRQTQSWFDVCPACARNLPTMRCDACNKRRFQLQPGSPICHGCLSKLLKEKIFCAACGATDYAFISDPTRCRKCHIKVERRNWKKSRPKTIVCLSCGAQKPGWKKTQMICQTCDNKRRNGKVNCVFTGCKKQMAIKTSQRCRQHHEDCQAPTLLKEYFKSYTSPFPQNQVYMGQLASTLSWEAADNGLMRIRGRDLARFRACGSFLETHELPVVLTWHGIDQALPLLGETNSVKIGFIRSCLFELGNLLAERGEIQDRSSHLQEKGIRRSLQRCPALFLSSVSRFEHWLLTGMLNPSLRLSLKANPLTNTSLTIAQNISAVIRFLNFCAAHNTVSLTDVGPSVIAKYQQTLLWQWKCKECHNRFAFESVGQGKKCANKECEGVGSCVKIRRLARGTLIAHISHLRTFFDWAQLHQIVPANPFSTISCGGARTFTVRDASGRLTEIAQSIRRYDDAKVEKLCAYIVSPEADVEEAVVLYFIIFHLFTNGDLRKLKILSPLRTNRLSAADRANSFHHLCLPLRQPTRGQRSLTRTHTKIRFPRKARSWLIPILECHYKKRAKLVKTDQQQHFLVGEKTARSNKPVTKDYVADRVRKASLRVLGGVITPSDLRRTAADIVGQRSKRRGAILTAMGYSRLAATRFNYLERFPLQLRISRSASGPGPSPRAKRR